MKIKIFILIAVFSMFFVACDKKMKWENENDPNADIYGKCENDSHKCYGEYLSLVCKKGMWENFESCTQKRPCIEETGMCLQEAGDEIYSGDENGNYVENNRVVVQLAWKQGFKSKLDSEFDEGVSVDLDLHMVKMNSIEAERYGFERTDGLLGTSMKWQNFDCDIIDPLCERYWRHDDCSAFDSGKLEDGVETTIAWGATFGIDNTWGGGNYKNPETVFMGSTKDADGDGIPDTMIPDDQYLVVATYGNCVSNYRYGENRCDKGYQGSDGAYEVDARVTIFVDGEEVPRADSDDRPADHYYETSKDFTIRLNEWKVVAVIKWDNSLNGPESHPEYFGNAIVSDNVMPESGIKIDPVRYPVCVFDTSDAVLVPIWNEDDYVNHITIVDSETSSFFGTCYQPEEPVPTEGDKRIVKCYSLLPYAEWNTSSKIVQEWNGEDWIPSNKGVYNENPSTTECHFKCKENYSWNGTECIADTRIVTCEGLPEHAEWFSVSEITQTWNGTEWMPTATANNCYNSSTEYCCFKCSEHYEWDYNQICSPVTITVECAGKPDGATWNVSVIYQTWDDEAGDYLPSSETSYYDGDNAPDNNCTFRCSDYYEWINSECLKNPCLPDNPCEGIENSNGQCVLFEGEGYLGYSCDCYDGYYWTGETCAKECNPDTCFKTHTCSGVVGGFERTATVSAHGTCNSTNGSCDCEPGWITGTSSYGTGTTLQCESAGNIFETLNNVECTVCDISNPPSEYATSGCPQSLTGDTSLCSSTDSTFCGPNGTCYYGPTGSHRLYCECNLGFYLDNGDKYNGFCVEQEEEDDDEVGDEDPDQLPDEDA